MKNLSILFIIVMFLSSCGALQEAQDNYRYINRSKDNVNRLIRHTESTYGLNRYSTPDPPSRPLQSEYVTWDENVKTSYVNDAGDIIETVSQDSLLVCPPRVQRARVKRQIDRSPNSLFRSYDDTNRLFKDVTRVIKSIFKIN